MPTTTHVNCNLGAAVALMYEAPNTLPMICFGSTVFRIVQSCVAPFSLFSMKLRSTSGASVSANDTHVFNLRRGGDFLIAAFHVLTVPGIYAAAAASEDFTGLLGVDAGTGAFMPYYCDFAGIFLVKRAVLNLSSAALASVTDEGSLGHCELLGAAGNGYQKMVGKYSTVKEQQERAQREQTFVVPVALFFWFDLGFAMPLAMLSWNVASIQSTLRSLSDVIVKPAATLLMIGHAAADDADEADDAWGTLALYKRAEAADLTFAAQGVTTPLGDSHLVTSEMLLCLAWTSKAERVASYASTHFQYAPFMYTQSQTFARSSAATEDIEQSMELRCNQAVEGMIISCRRTREENAKDWANVSAGFVDTVYGGAASASSTVRQAPIIKLRVEINSTPRHDLQDYELYGVQQLMHCSTSTDLHLAVVSYSAQLGASQYAGWNNNAKQDEVMAYFIFAQKCWPADVTAVAASRPAITETTKNLRVHITHWYRARLNYRNTHLSTDYLPQVNSS